MDDDLERSDAAVIGASVDDPASFGVIFDRHFTAIHMMLARRLGRDAADELASEVFAVAFERRARFDTIVPDARPWLYGIAVNIARRHLRTRTSRRALQRRAQQPTIDDRPVGEELERREEQDRLAVTVPRAIASLAPRDRDALLLHCWEGLSYDDVALTLGVPVGTVRSRINRARNQLRAALLSESRSEGEHHA